MVHRAFVDVKSKDEGQATPLTASGRMEKCALACITEVKIRAGHVARMIMELREELRR